MEKKGKITNFLFPVAMLGFLYLVFRYQDTETFQNALDFLFKPNSDHALLPVWRQHRMLFLAIPLAACFLWYKSTWHSYRNLLRIYRDSPVVTKQPDISALQASYFLRQDQVSSLTTWLLEMCNRGAASLCYKKGITPWALQKRAGKNINPQDKQLLDILFRNSDYIDLKAPLHDPVPEVKETAETLFNEIKEKYHSFFHTRQYSLPAWLLLFGLIGEIPFYLASLETNMITTLPVTIFSTIVCVAPAYVFCKYLPTYFKGSKLIAGIFMTLSILFVLFAHSLLYSSSSTAPYLATSLYPNITAILLTLLHMVPLLPKDSNLLLQIVGYQKYLARDGYSTEEKDLPWTLGLGIHADIIDSSFRYGSTSIPAWLDNTTDKDLQEVMKLFHQTFATHVNKAVYGEMDEKSRGNSLIGRRGY